jgi:cyclic pyranopterin phosphate synthase
MRDGFGREITYLRISVTELCNLRCRYCMPAEGVCKRRHEEMLNQEEMLRAVRVAAELGIRKLRITGGEPLVKRNILDICERAASTPGIEEICLTTNGIMLPGLAKPLRAAGVSRLNVSLDTLDARKYAWMTRVGVLDDALKGVEAALEAGFERVKLNAVLIGGWNDDEAIRKAGAYCYEEREACLREMKSIAFETVPDGISNGTSDMRTLPFERSASRT